MSLDYDKYRGTYYVRPPVWLGPSRTWWQRLMDWYHNWRG